MRSYKARGIVLHTIKYGDSSLVAYLLTDTLGRQSYMVQGVRSGRGHGNKGALLQPMFALELEGIVPPRGEMHRIREMRAVVPLRSTPFDVRKSTIALFMAEMLYRLVREVEPSSPLFDFVWGAVGALDEMGSGADFGIGAAAGSGSGGGAGAADSLASGVGSGSGSGSGAAAEVAAAGSGSGGGMANFHLWFMAQLSRHLGFAPGNEWAEGHFFDIREGLFTPIMPRHGIAFSRENAALLGRLVDMAADEIATLPLNRIRRVDFLNAMLAYFGYHLDAVRDVRSVEILREVF